jgi:hypothetical protein
MASLHIFLTIRDRQDAAKNLVLQYRIERAAKWTGRVGLVMLAIGILCMIVGPMRPNHFYGT